MEIYKKEKNKQIALSEAKEGLRSVNFAEVRVNENGFGIIRINNVDEYLTKSQTTYFNLLTTKKRTTFEDFVYFFKVLEIKDRYNGEGKYGLYHFGKYMCELTVMETEYFEKNRKNLQEKEPNMLPLKSSTRKVYSPNI